jgi:cell wall-associated NlpC family hydrolase
MKHLFFVAVAVGIFSGTSISAGAQTSVNSLKLGSVPPQSKTFKFIEGIEVKRDVTAKSADDLDVWAAPLKKSTTILDVNYEPVKANLAAPVVTTSNIENISSLQFKYAQLMGVEVESISNTALYEAIEEWWATRYRYGGTTKHGIDCSALTGTLLTQAYGFKPERTARAQYAQCQKISRDELQEGDLVFFNTTGGISHVGMYLNNSYFVHASSHNGVTISSLDENYYSRKYIGGGRILIAQ